MPPFFELMVFPVSLALCLDIFTKAWTNCSFFMELQPETPFDLAMRAKSLEV
jgi:hypothetical protein